MTRFPLSDVQRDRELDPFRCRERAHGLRSEYLAQFAARIFRVLRRFGVQKRIGGGKLRPTFRTPEMTPPPACHRLPCRGSDGTTEQLTLFEVLARSYHQTRDLDEGQLWGLDIDHQRPVRRQACRSQPHRAGRAARGRQLIRQAPSPN